MRHLKAGRKFGRNPSNRRAMFRNLTANLITHERIETTDAKAKELRRVAEKLITKAVRLGAIAYEKPGDSPDRNSIAKRLHVARQIRAFIPRFGVFVDEDGEKQSVDLVEKVLIDLAKRFQGRPGGYTRIIKLGPRRGDNAPMSLIEFVSSEDDAQSSGEVSEVEPAKALAPKAVEAAEEPKAEEPAEEPKADEPTEEPKAEVAEEAADK